MELEPIRFIVPTFTFEDGRPAAGIYVHLDILGDDEIKFQHFRTDDKGRLLSGNRPAMLKQGEYDLCATTNDVEDDIMERYKPLHVDFREVETVAIPEEIVIPWEWKSTRDYIDSLESDKDKFESELSDMHNKIGELEEVREALEKEKEAILATGSMSEEEREKLKNIYSNIEIAKKKIDENWEMVEKGKTKLKILLDKQEDTLKYLESAELEKREIMEMKEELDLKEKQIDIIYNAIIGDDERLTSLLASSGEGEPTGWETEFGDTAGGPDIETLTKIHQHILNINEKRKQLEVAREKILLAKDQLRNRKDGMMALSDEMAETIRQYDQLLGEIRQEKQKLANIKEKLFDGWEKLKVEYADRVREAEFQFKTIEKEKAILKAKKDKVSGLFFEGKDKIHTDQHEILGNKQKLAELGSSLRKQSEKVKEAIVAKRKFEEKFDALREESAILEKRDTELRRSLRKMEREHALRMEAYAQNDSDIEAEFKTLEEMRSLVNMQREDFMRDRLEFLKESMYYECPVCGGTIPVKSSKRPLRVHCPSCETEFNLKVKQKYQCPECEETIPVTNAKRPLNIKCQKCGSEYILRAPFKHEEDNIPDVLKEKVKTS